MEIFICQDLVTEGWVEMMSPLAFQQERFFCGAFKCEGINATVACVCGRHEQDP